jgi:hypothetical protein
MIGVQALEGLQEVGAAWNVSSGHRASILTFHHFDDGNSRRL